MPRPTLLMVEDNPDHLELAIMTLEENGADHQIVVARNGPDALDYLFCEGRYSDRPLDMPPELVMLDLGLPGMSGLEVLQRMRDDPRTFFVPVMMLTSASETSKAVLAFKGGLNSYVRKPLYYRDFQEKLEQARDYWRTSNFVPLSSGI
ncbi:MAG: response regulator [Polaromonas sp.]|nr:response regulator [Polaromonas sp.]